MHRAAPPWTSYHLLGASLSPTEHDPERLFAWSVRAVVDGFTPHGDYVAQAERAAERALPAAHVQTRMAQLIGLDANPVAALMTHCDGPDAFAARWNGFNALAPLGVQTMLVAPAAQPGALRRAARLDSAQAALRAWITTECVQQLARQAETATVRNDDPQPLATRAAALRLDRGALGDCILQPHADPAASLASCAHALGVSPRTLQRDLGARGLAFGTLRQAVRITRAGHALRTGTESLTEVAQAAGFFDSAHFAHAWRRACGLAPSHYRALATAQR